MNSQIFLKHGTARLRPFPDYASASAFYCAKRDKSGKGASQFLPAMLYDESTGRLLGHISYNGRVWPGLPQSWRPGTVPLFTPPDPAPPYVEVDTETAYGSSIRLSRSIRVF